MGMIIAAFFSLFPWEHMEDWTGGAQDSPGD